MNFLEHIKAGNVVEVAQYLEAHPTIVFERSEHDWTPLHYVSALGPESLPAHGKIAELLILFGADANAKASAAELTPIHMIAINGSKESTPVARVLLDNGADILAKSTVGQDWRLLWQHGCEIFELLSSYDPRDPEQF